MTLLSRLAASADRAYEGWRLERFRNHHVGGRRCFLIGNGPSLRNQDLSRLRGEIVFVTNKFVLHAQHDRIAPSYYCVSDTEFFEHGVEPTLAALLREKAARMISFLPHASKQIVRRDRLFSGDVTYFLRFADPQIPVWQLGTMSLDPPAGVHVAETVIVDFCLPLAFFMGFSEVYLLGCDTDYGLDEAEDYSRGYFYDVHAQPAFRNPVHHRTTWYPHVVASYEVARRLFEAHGRRIFNATAGGKLEVFPRVSLGELFP